MKIISFEGIEGVGKSTQIDLLHDYLLKAGKSVKKFREPGSTIPSEKIRNILLDANLTLTSQTELLLMYASRSELVANEILSNQHDFILLDRYFDASMAYQGYGRQLNLSFISSLENLVHPDLQPDLTLILDVPVNIAMGRVYNRGNLDRFEQEDVAFFNRVRAGYKEIAKNNIDRCREIDASKDLAEVQAEVMQIIRDFCKKQSNS